MAKATEHRTTRRRGLFAGAAALLAAGATAAAAIPAGPSLVGPLALPAGASPQIQAAIADYFAHMAAANAREASNEIADAMVLAMEGDAARLAAFPAQSLPDLAAKVLFFVEVMNQARAWNYVTEAEGDVLCSVETDVLALAGGAA